MVVLARLSGWTPVGITGFPFAVDYRTKKSAKKGALGAK